MKIKLDILLMEISVSLTSFCILRHKFLISYQGYYATMDAGYRDQKGYISVLSRNDDVINVAGHRLSAGALEEVMSISFM